MSYLIKPFMGMFMINNFKLWGSLDGKLLIKV